jgi:hypothetical protein
MTDRAGIFFQIILKKWKNIRKKIEGYSLKLGFGTGSRLEIQASVLENA